MQVVSRLIATDQFLILKPNSSWWHIDHVIFKAKLGKKLAEKPKQNKLNL